MSTTERQRDQATRRAARILQALSMELREARVARGLSQERVGRSIGVSHALVGRIERAEHLEVSVHDLVSVATAVGLDLSVRVYPGGAPLRDIGHLRLLSRFRAHLGQDFVWRAEVPIGIPGDQRAWDGVIFGPSIDPSARAAVEAETRIRDVQALARRIQLKKRDAGIDRVILVVLDSRTNRDAMRLGASDLVGFPLRSREVLSALRAGKLPADSGIVVL